MRTRRLGSARAGADDRRLRRVGDRRAVAVRLGRGRRRRLVAAIRRAVELGVNWVDTAAVYGLGHSEEVVGRALEPYRRRRGRARVHEVRPALGGPPGGRDRERPAPGVDPRGVRARACAGWASSASTSTRSTGPTGRRERRSRTRGGRWPSSSTRARCAGSASPTSTSSSSTRCEAVRHVDSVQPPLSLLARGARTTVHPVGGRARRRRDLLLADGLGAAHGRVRPRRGIAALGRRRLAPRVAGVPGAACSRGTSRSSTACARSPTSSATTLPAARRRLGARAARRHRRDRRRAHRRATSTAGRPPRTSRSTTRSCGAIDARDRRDRRRLRRAARAARRTSARPHRATEASPMRLGLLSTANINDGILGGAQDTDRVEVVAVASRDGARAEAYAARARTSPRAHGSYEALLADDEVDAVYISLPNATAPRVDDARARGGQARPLREAVLAPPGRGRGGVRRAPTPPGVVLMEAFMYRHHPQTDGREDARRGRRRRDGAARARVVPVRRCTTLDDIRASTELDGGALMDVGCYCVSGSRLLAGEPEHVRGGAGARPVRHRHVVSRDDAVRRATSSGSSTARSRCPSCQRLEVDGEEGTLVVESPVAHRLAGRRASAPRRRGRAPRRAGRSTRTASSSRTSRTPPRASRPRSSAGRTPSARRVRSTRSTARRRRDA